MSLLRPDNLFRPLGKRCALRCGIAVMVAAALAVNTPTASTQTSANPAAGPSVLEIQRLVNAMLPGTAVPTTGDGSHASADILRLQRALAEAETPEAPATCSPCPLAILPQLTSAPVGQLQGATRPVMAIRVGISASRPAPFTDPPVHVPGRFRYLFNLMPNAPPVMGESPILLIT